MELTSSTHFLVGFLALLMMLGGLAGALVPVLPGIELIWLACLAYGIFSGWGLWAWVMFPVITIVLIVGEVVIWWLGNTTARYTGASWTAIAASVVLGLIGMFVIPVIGAIIGAMLGVFLVELYKGKNWRAALKITTGVLWGAGLSFGAQVIFGLVMIALWGIWFYLRAMEIVR